MLNLNKITLVAVSCDKIQQTIRAINICKKEVLFKKVKFFTNEKVKLEDIEVIEIPKLDIYGYNKFLFTELYKYIDTEFVLIVHWDGFILNKDAWNEDFLNYDYIGAPWWLNDDFNVGNGGFSLRSKKLIEFIKDLPPLKDNKYEVFNGERGVDYFPEDAIICRYYGKFLKDVGFKFAPEKLASIFSIEGNPKTGYFWNGQFGFHGPSVKNMPIPLN